MFSKIGLFYVLSSFLTAAHCCDWLRHYGHLSNNSLTLIDGMGGPLTQDDSPVPFPHKLYSRMRNSEVESQLVFIRDSLKLIFDLYHHDNISSAGWDTTRTEHFLMSIDRQIDGFNSCVSTNKTVNRQLRNYYRKLRISTLQHMGGSAASWELLRSETKRHLHQLDLLVASIKAAASASRRRSTATREQQ